jgi:hypothetical protein
VTATVGPTSLAEAFRLQALACAGAGSDLYGRLLEGAADDLAAGGVVAEVVAPHREDPTGSALALRFLGAVHRIVLEGRAPALARHYPSMGGAVGDADPVPDLLATVAEHRAELTRRTGDGVQTNEVGRSAVLVGGFAAVAARFGLPLRVLELGASAGLNLRWDRYCYDTGVTVAGDPDSPVRFHGIWEGDPPDLRPEMVVAERRGCDRNPIDPVTPFGRLTLQSYVWPDQLDRIARLRAALEVARTVPVTIDRADAADWLERRLRRPAPGMATVVVHSIVVQYLPAPSRRRVRAALEAAGAVATPAAPLCWLRMEPGGDRADLRSTTWPGGDDVLLARAGYHGRPIRWLG